MELRTNDKRINKLDSNYVKIIDLLVARGVIWIVSAFPRVESQLNAKLMHFISASRNRLHGYTDTTVNSIIVNKVSDEINIIFTCFVDNKDPWTPSQSLQKIECGKFRCFIINIFLPKIRMPFEANLHSYNKLTFNCWKCCLYFKVQSLVEIAL